jgi:hypothetical protein
MKVTTQSLQASLPCMMQPSHSIVSVAIQTGSREPVTITPWARQERALALPTGALPTGWTTYRRTTYGRDGIVTIVVPGGGAKVDAGGFAV